MKLYNDYHQPKISGQCGNMKIHVEDFNKLKCPICNTELQISEMDMSIDPTTELNIMHTCSHVDDIGQIHSQTFGRTEQTNHVVLHMSCPNKCVEDMKCNIYNTTYGKYRELTELY